MDGSDIFIITGLIVLSSLAALALYDFFQPHNAVLRNFPLLGHFRYILSFSGEFFRQYWGALDREEKPFNRAQREWMNRASDNNLHKVSFGSTKDLRAPGQFKLIAGHNFLLKEEAIATPAITFGPYAKRPYTTSAFLHISAMGFGPLSGPAVEALSLGAEKAGIWMNSGESGVSKYHFAGKCDVVYQIGTGKVGVKDSDGNLSDEKLRHFAEHPQIKMFEIKVTQGAYPGMGGYLPAVKMTPEVAKQRGVEPYKDSPAPERHKDIKTAADLLNMVNRIRTVTGLPVGFKTVFGREEWWEELADEIHHRGIESAPDYIVIDGAEGGTGAGMLAWMDSMDLSIRESLPRVVDKLIEHGLKERIKILASGKLVMPGDVAWALAMGADAVYTARGFMFALGCIQALRCAENTCPVGIAAHNKYLQRGIVPESKAARVARYARNIQEEVEGLARSCGVAHPRLLRREHVLMTGEARSTRLDQLYPYPKALQSRQQVA